MLQAVLTVTRTMTTTATAVMDTDQVMDTDHMPPDMGMDRIHTGHMRVHTAPGGGNAISAQSGKVEPTRFKKWDLRYTLRQLS